MWGQGAIYFISDREDGTLNIYAYDTATKQTKRLTFFKDYDVKWPSYGDGQIVFQHGAALKVLDTASGQVREVPISVHSDRRHVREELIDDAPSVGAFGLSPGGERVVLEARGEMLNLPVEDGDAFNLTAHQRLAREERDLEPRRRAPGVHQRPHGRGAALPGRPARAAIGSS